MVLACLGRWAWILFLHTQKRETKHFKNELFVTVKKQCDTTGVMCAPPPFSTEKNIYIGNKTYWYVSGDTQARQTTLSAYRSPIPSPVTIYF